MITKRFVGEQMEFCSTNLSFEPHSTWRKCKKQKDLVVSFDERNISTSFLVSILLTLFDLITRHFSTKLDYYKQFKRTFKNIDEISMFFYDYPFLLMTTSFIYIFWMFQAVKRLCHLYLKSIHSRIKTHLNCNCRMNPMKKIHF